MSESERLRCVVMRGGTSKALFFHENDLPSDVESRDRVILKAFGSPDIRQIDGLGGANSSTSKVAIIGVSKKEGADIDYSFGQVSLDLPIVGKEMNCGNISSAVGPFAIDEGLVKAVEPITTVRIFNTNTEKIIVAHVPVNNGKAVTRGDFEINGVPGTGARIDLEFLNPEGAVTGDLLPTGVPIQVMHSEGKEFHVSIVDAANPIVFVKAEELGLRGTELPWELERRPDSKSIMAILENIRGQAAQMIGLVEDASMAATTCPTLPKIGFYTKPAPYVDGAGRKVATEKIDLVGRLISMGKMIHAYMGTGAVCTIVAANIPGTVISDLVTPELGKSVSNLRIGHPFGVMNVEARLSCKNGSSFVESATFSRTARRLMEGWIYIPRED
ncbi:MAG TPA: PrpF domain-containing protein [Synergistales bacterium]|nr:PrpF domain-containing protein [Synergistales bacterium]